MRIVIDLPDEQATMALGRRLGAALFPGAVVALVGSLGAGKTFLTRAIAEGLGIRDARAVTSPTFVLIQEYDARLPIYHFDTYRLPGSAAFATLGVHEYFEGEGVCLIEWADRVADQLPADHLRIELEMVSKDARRAILNASGTKHAQLLGQASGRRQPPDAESPG